nr:protein folded gastrulation [Drosophila virilis]
MASSSRGIQQSSGCGWLLLVHGLLALTALHMHSLKGAAVEALPITSRPIEGNAQKDAWEAWLRLPYEQKSLEKQKKVMPKSIFALPFRHCPPGHKLYNERCIPQINIDPTDLVAQELQGALGEGGEVSSGSPTDYDYSDSESDEQLYEMSLGPFAQKDQLSTQPSASGAEDQALPSEDAPLKFNIFEKKFPTAPEAVLQPDVVNATTATTATSTSMTTPTPTPTIATMREDALKAQRQPDNRIAEGAEDLQADASNALPSTTILSISSSSSSSSIGSFSDIGNIDAIVVPAGGPLGAEPSVQLVTSSMRDVPEPNVVTKPNADAGAKFQAEAEPVAEAEAETEAEGETDLEQLLKVDAFLPAYGSSVDMMPPFSHRRVSPLLSADLDLSDDTATDIVPAAADSEADTTTTTATTAATASLATPTTTTLSSAQPRVPGEEQELDRVVVKKSKVQPVQLSSITETTAATTTAATPTATATTMTSIATSAAAVTTTTAATVAAAAETEVAAIHQDANGNTRDDDRFYYQPFARDVAASASSSSSSSIADGDLDVLNDMASSDNLMTNTIGGQGDSEKAASEINFEQELRIINELVKDKRRLSQLRQQQQEQQSTSSSTTIPTTATATTTAATATIIESSSDASSTATATTSTTATTAAATTATATETTNFWSSLMPMLGLSSTESTAATEQSAETITTTAVMPTATTATTGNVAESSTATVTAAAKATTTNVANTKSTQHLSINTNRSNRNSKIIRVDSFGVSPQPISTATAATAATSAIAATAATGKFQNVWMRLVG